MIFRSGLRCLIVAFTFVDSKVAYNALSKESDQVDRIPLLPPEPKIVTIGDSYSSGTGIHRSGSDYDEEFGGQITHTNGRTYKMTVRRDNECWRETNQTPGPMLASDRHLTSVFLACKGAEISHVENQFDYLNALYSRDRAYYWKGSTIVLTAGGNDIRFKDGHDWPSLLTRCITYRAFFGDCTRKSWSDVAGGSFKSIETRLTALFLKISSQARDATIRVLGYPRLMQRDPRCGSVTGIDRDEADYMDTLADALNDAVKGAVLAVQTIQPMVDLEFVDVYPYLTVGACGNGPNKRHVHDKRLDGFKTSDSSFHPSLLGYEQYYEALTASL